MRRLGVLLGSLTVLFGCPGASPVPPSPDAGAAPGADAGESGDGGGDGGYDAGPDSGTPDSGFDAGTPDAGPRCTGRTLGAGDFSRDVTSGSSTRHYLLHVPAQYDPTRPAMLVVAAHGLLMSPSAMAQLTHFDDVANERGFLVAYPEGLSQSFNAGICCGVASATLVDDVAFFGAMLDDIAADFCVDPSRVHVTGFSNGGFMAHRVGCELAGRVASIGPVAGEMGVVCSPSRPMPVVMVHGTADPVVPYGGNPILGYVPTQTTMHDWATRDGCASTSTRLWADGGDLAETWSGCDGGAEVTLYTIGGLMHDWAGGGSAWDAGAGFNTTRALVDFFVKHPRP